MNKIFLIVNFFNNSFTIRTNYLKLYQKLQTYKTNNFNSIILICGSAATGFYINKLHKNNQSSKLIQENFKQSEEILKILKQIEKK